LIKINAHRVFRRGPAQLDVLPLAVVPYISGPHPGGECGLHRHAVFVQAEALARRSKTAVTPRSTTMTLFMLCAVVTFLVFHVIGWW
jgi:hypothetical protein